MIRLPRSGRHFDDRCDIVFSRTPDLIQSDLKALLARHSASGQLQSGNTIIEAVAIWERRIRDALEKVTGEFGKVITTRGIEWRRAMKAVETSLGAAHRLAPSELASTFRVATSLRLQEGRTAETAQDLIDTAAARLHSELADFSAGWTAPVPKHWNERHPILHAIGMALFGAALALVGKSLIP